MFREDEQPVGRGCPASPGQARGKLRFIRVNERADFGEPRSVSKCERLERGDVLLCEGLFEKLTEPSKRVEAIVTEETQTAQPSIAD
jgi:hypothetical protein